MTKSTKAKAVRVAFKQAEKVRRYLIKEKIIRDDLKITKDDNFIYFPVNKLSHELKFYKVLERKFEKRERIPKTYKDIISIPDKNKKDLPTSYDVIGDIILLKLQKQLDSHKKEIGEALLKSNKHVKTVCLVQPVAGELRTRNVEIIAGEKRTKTTHIEYGLRFNLDIKKTYFSPRLANERRRVVNLVKEDEIVVDMFAGVAPFSIMIAKYSDPRIVYAIDKNKDAVDFAKLNIKINNVLDKIEIIHADAKKASYFLDKKGAKADRIIMNLPLSSYLFFEQALKIAANKCVIHYYDILEEKKIESRITHLKKIAKENGYILEKISIKKIKTYAPREFYIRIDITARKHAAVAQPSRAADL